MRALLAGLVLSLATLASATAAPVRPGYVPAGGDCGGYPRAPIGLAPGICAGLVVAPPPAGLRPSQRTLRLPRTFLAQPDGSLLVVDLGSWEPGHGAVWRLQPQIGGPPKLARLLSGLDLPHTLAVGPDGRLYLGEMSRIVRFSPDAPDPAATLETVVDGLPSNRLHDNRHPLSSFIFDADGALLVDVGARSDQCPPPASGACEEIAGDRPSAAVWRFAYLGAGRWAEQPSVFARGLRNSLALVRTPAGSLLQGENSIDIDDPAAPFDEINLLRPGGDYGWPYCVGARDVAPAWRGRSPALCAAPAYTRPALLLPPHAAPLALMVYDGPMFPQLRGKLLVTLHGFRRTGGRIIAYDLDAAGVPKPAKGARFFSYAAGRAPRAIRYGAGPAADGLVLTPRWDASPGVRPQGAPVGLAVTPDGAIWIADDRNGAILRLARDD